jgi:hypothetical protein
VLVAPSLNAPLLAHPGARASMARLRTWGVDVIEPVDTGDGPRLAPTPVLVEHVRSSLLADRPLS